MFWDNYRFSVGDLLQVVGIFCVTRLVWCHGIRKFIIWIKSPNIKNTEESQPENQDQAAAALLKLADDVTLLRLQIEMLKPDSQENAGQAREDQTNGISMATRTLQEKSNDSMKKIGAVFQRLCDSHIYALKVFHSAALQKLTEDELKDQDELKVMQEEVGKLKEIQRKFQDRCDSFEKECESIKKHCENAIKKLQEGELQIIRQNFHDFRSTLDREFTSLKGEGRVMYESFKKDCEASMKDMQNLNLKAIQEKYKDLRLSLIEEMADIRTGSRALCETVKEEMEDLDSRQKAFFAKLETNLFTTIGRDVMQPEVQQEGNGGNVIVTSLYWKVTEFRKRLQFLVENPSVAVITENFFIRGEIQIKSSLRLCETGEYVLLELQFIYEEQSPAPFLHYRRCYLIAQSENSAGCNMELIDRPYFQMNTLEDTKMSSFNNSNLCRLEYLQSDNIYVKNDEIAFAIYIEPIDFLSKHIICCDGINLWKIEDYSRKKQAEIDGATCCYTSELFKTSETGYNVQLQAFLNGDENYKGSSMSLFLQFILGENDDSLPIPFTAKISFHLLDQSETQSDVIETIDFEFTSKRLDWGVPDFVQQDVAEQPQYLKDDTLYIKAVVEIQQI